MQQQQNEAEKPNLEVRICPTRNGLTQLAQFMITNKSRRPIHIQAWAVGSANKAISSLGVRDITGHPYGGKLPKILAEQERIDIIADLTGTDWKNMISAGVYDNTNRFWPVPENAIKQFMETAERHAPQPGVHHAITGDGKIT